MAITFEDLSRPIGALVKGVDLSQPIDQATTDTLLEVIGKRKILLFRQGEITTEQQLALLSSFAPPMTETPGGEPWSRVSNIHDAFVDAVAPLPFHADYSYAGQGQCEFISLYAEVMERAQPTTYVNMVEALEKLPADLRAQMEQLKVVQCYDFSADWEGQRRQRLSNKRPEHADAEWIYATHPMIATHTRTGERYVNYMQSHTSHVLGWSDEESDALFEEIERYVYTPDLKYTHQWQEHDLLIWDNKALQHGREALSAGSRRALRRVAANAYDADILHRGLIANQKIFPGMIPFPDNPVAA